jgi:hypothetical protein
MPVEYSRSMNRGVSLARRVFTIAAIYGILVLFPQYFMEEIVGHYFPPPITHAENFYGFIGVALAWQVLFLLIARDPIRYRPAMIPAMLEKLAFGIPCIVLFIQGRVSSVILAAGVVDLILLALFVISYRATAKKNQEFEQISTPPSPLHKGEERNKPSLQ